MSRRSILRMTVRNPALAAAFGLVRHHRGLLYSRPVPVSLLIREGRMGPLAAAYPLRPRRRIL